MKYPQQSEVETEGPEVQGHPQLQEVSLGYYMGPFSKIKKVATKFIKTVLVTVTHACSPSYWRG